MNHHLHEELSLKEIQKGWPQTLKLYLTGFVICLLLTGLSFGLAALQLFSVPILIAILAFLAVTQAFVQLIFFMHFGKEEKPRWMMLVFYFMVLVLAIVIPLTLWIISDLNHRMMSNMPPLMPGL